MRLMNPIPAHWCPHCGCNDTSVISSEKRTYRIGGKAVTRRMRRHECRHCGARFTTREEVLPGSVRGPKRES